MYLYKYVYNMLLYYMHSTHMHWTAVLIRARLSCASRLNAHVIFVVYEFQWQVNTIALNNQWFIIMV